MEAQKITPCLWFNGDAENAVDFYTSIFKNTRKKGVTRYGDNTAKVSGQAKGSVMTVLFELEGYEMMALNGGPHFQFSQAISFFVACETEQEIDNLWARLSKAGKTMMGLDKYPWAPKYGWCADKFGVSWQLILANRRQKISPALLFVNDQAGRAEEAMRFYTSLFRNSKIESTARDEKTGVILHARFTLAGQDFVAMESSMSHAFAFNPALSFIAGCENQAEIDELWLKLSAVKEAEQCGWLTDKFGVSWQIVPQVLSQWMLDKDPKKAERIMESLLKMKKLDLQTLKQAAEQ